MVYFGGFFAILGYFAGFPLVTLKFKSKSKSKSKILRNRFLDSLNVYKYPGMLIWALVAKGHKNTNAPLIFENLRHYFFWFWANYIMGHFSGYFEGAKTFLTPKLSRAQRGAI